jgi:hypothetical protein
VRQGLRTTARNVCQRRKSVTGWTA